MFPTHLIAVCVTTGAAFTLDATISKTSGAKRRVGVNMVPLPVILSGKDFRFHLLELSIANCANVE